MASIFAPGYPTPANTVAVKAPGFGDRRKEMLQDIACVTGATVVSEEVGLKLESVELGMLGTARKIISTKENTTIIEGRGKKEEIEARINQIRKEIKTIQVKTKRYTKIVIDTKKKNKLKTLNF